MRSPASWTMSEGGDAVIAVRRRVIDPDVDDPDIDYDPDDDDWDDDDDDDDEDDLSA